MFINTPPEDLTILLHEYRSLVDTCQKAVDACPDEFEYDEFLHTLLLANGWTPGGASTLLNLAKQQGTFILRNALALAIALEVEDGTLGL